MVFIPKKCNPVHVTKNKWEYLIIGVVFVVSSAGVILHIQVVTVLGILIGVPVMTWFGRKTGSRTSKCPNCGTMNLLKWGTSRHTCINCRKSLRIIGSFENIFQYRQSLCMGMEDGDEA